MVLRGLCSQARDMEVGVSKPEEAEELLRNLAQMAILGFGNVALAALKKWYELDQREQLRSPTGDAKKESSSD